jgi:acyl-CoA thioester hydrolase
MDAVTTAQDTAPPPPPGRFRVGEFVRWSDVDLAGIICYGAYVRLFEIAETELFRAVGFPFSELFERFDFWLPRAQLHFEFRRPALLDDHLDLEMWISKVGTSSLRLQFEALKADRKLTAEGHAVLVAVARRDLRPIPLPPGFVAALAPYRADLA